MNSRMPAFSEDKVEEALAKVHALPSIKENMIVSTCNRVRFTPPREDRKSHLWCEDFLSRLPWGLFEDSKKAL